MRDEELRQRFDTWAALVPRPLPPDVSVIRRRARRRVIRLAAGGIAVVAAAAAVAVVLAGVRPAGHATPVAPVTSTPTSHAPRPAAFTKAPYYVTVGLRTGSATVRRTASGKVVATVQPPPRARLISVAAAADDRTFVLAAQTGPTIRFYRLRLGAAGRPGPLELTSVPPPPRQASGCSVQLAGLAVTPDGRRLAVSTLSDCANGRAGPSEIDTASLASGAILATFRPGNGYPLWLSWTAAGALAYDWSGPSPGVWLIPAAASAGQPASPRLLIRASAGIRGYTGQQHPMITPDGTVVIVTLGRGTSLEVAEFSALTGRPVRVLIPAVKNPFQYCGPLWTDPTGKHLLAACGANAEASIDNGHLTHLPRRWLLPFYPIPGGPQIAW